MSERDWHDHHLAAGYHLQEWVAPREDSQLIGQYQGATGVITVRWLAEGPTGAPELELQFGEQGAKVTVLDENTALMYLALEGAVTAEAAP